MSIVLSHITSGDTWSLDQGVFTIGRALDCGVRIEDPRISRHHAMISVEGDHVSVRDLGSKNGLFVNGSHVTESEIRVGDRISLGPVDLVVSEEQQASARGGVADFMRDERRDSLVERGAISTVPSLDSTRLKALYDAVEAVVGHISLEEILPAVLDTLEGLFSYDRCSLVLKDRKGMLVTWASRPEGVSVPYSRTVAGRVLERGDALLYDDIQGEAPFDLGESVMGLNIHSVICSPLIFRGEIKGLVYLDRSVAGSYSVDDLAMLRSISNLVAIGLENARLYSELQKRYEQKSYELREVQARLIQSERTAALGHLAQAMAHNIRNPVMILGGVVKRMRKGLGHGQPVLERDLDSILWQAEKLEKIMQRVDSLINLPEAASRLIPIEDTLASAITDCFLPQARIHIHSSLNRRPIPHDPQLTKIAMCAVLQDAIASSGREVELYVFAGELEDGWYMDISDADSTGARQDYKGIFDPFFRSHPWSVDMGLTLGQRAMEYQGGDLLVAAGTSAGNRVRLVFKSGG